MVGKNKQLDAGDTHSHMQGRPLSRRLLVLAYSTHARMLLQCPKKDEKQVGPAGAAPARAVTQATPWPKERCRRGDGKGGRKNSLQRQEQDQQARKGLCLLKRQTYMTSSLQKFV